VHDAASDVSTLGGAPRDGVVERRDRESGLHPRVDRVADDPVGVDVLERAQVELALDRLVLGDVTHPQLVRLAGGELVADHAVLVDHGAQVVMNRRTGLLRLLGALGLAEGRPPA